MNEELSNSLRVSKSRTNITEVGMESRIRLAEMPVEGKMIIVQWQIMERNQKSPAEFLRIFQENLKYLGDYEQIAATIIYVHEVKDKFK